MVARSSTNCSTLRPWPCMARGNRGQLILAGLQRRREIAGRGAVVEGARGGEAERAGAHGIACERGHRLVVLDRRGIAPRAALAHHIDAQALHAAVARRCPCRSSASTASPCNPESSPIPGNAGAQHRLRNILDAFHQFDQPAVIGRPARRKADAAIAHDRGGDAVLRGGRDVLAPGDLAVVMGVYVDKAGRDQFAPGVDLFLALAGNFSDFADAAAAMAISASNKSPPLPSAMLPPRITRSGLSVMASLPGFEILLPASSDDPRQSTAGNEVLECISR